MDVTLLGLGPSRNECSFSTEELWGTVDCLNQDDLRDKQFTKVFAFDGISLCVNDHAPRKNEILSSAIDKAHAMNIPLVSTKDYGTERYPIIEIGRKFKTSYFMPTISYMIAYALYLGYNRIYIYGIDQGPQWWYQLGKPHITFWLGYAIALGVEVYLGRGSMQWAYYPGLDGLPIAWLKEEYEKLYVDLFDTVVIEK